MEKWEVRRDGVVIAWGPMETLPTAKERKTFRADGYKVFVDGKPFKD